MIERKWNFIHTFNLSSEQLNFETINWNIFLRIYWKNENRSSTILPSFSFWAKNTFSFLASNKKSCLHMLSVFFIQDFIELSRIFQNQWRHIFDISYSKQCFLVWYLYGLHAESVEHLRNFSKMSNAKPCFILIDFYQTSNKVPYQKVQSF